MITCDVELETILSLQFAVRAEPPFFHGYTVVMPDQQHRACARAVFRTDDKDRRQQALPVVRYAGIGQIRFVRLLTVCKAIEVLREVDGRYQNYSDVERYRMQTVDELVAGGFV